MSIKNKKSIRKTNNVYRLKRIEEYLISQGYIQTDPSIEFQRWVDCISGGRDICFNTSDVATDLPSRFKCNLDRELQEIGGYGKDGYLMIDAPRVHEVFSDASTVEEAVKRSRYAASWVT